MKFWPWASRDDDPREVVTEDRLADLEDARRLLEQRRRVIAAQRPIVEQLSDFFRRENEENHLAHRLRRAMEGRG